MVFVIVPWYWRQEWRSEAWTLLRRLLLGAIVVSAILVLYHALVWSAAESILVGGQAAAYHQQQAIAWLSYCGVSVTLAGAIFSGRFVVRPFR